LKDIQEILEGCKQGKPRCQEALYNLFGRKMMGICLRYANTRFEAEDVFHEAFVKVFQKINQYNGGGSFEGWMKRIFVTTSINNFHKNKKHYHYEEFDNTNDPSFNEDALNQISNEELLQVINQLPDGYRMVFNLFVIEGFTHQEIAELLKISEGTSKSQLSKAKQVLQKKLSQLNPTVYAVR
jgi:RNA polymerase sigma factor (sigma-70 family)